MKKLFEEYGIVVLVATVAAALLAVTISLKLFVNSPLKETMNTWANRETISFDNASGPPDYLCFTAKEANSTITLNQNGAVSWVGSYSTDSKNWASYTLGTTLTLADIGNKVYFKGTLNADQSTDKFLQYVMTGKIAASGNINSLHYENDFATRTQLIYSREYSNLFKNCTSLTQAPELPATTLTISCYYQIFRDCTSLTTTPELPATTLAQYCYRSMFYGCTSLTQAPDLPATTLANYCYYHMFDRCTSLTTTPKELPATTLAESCYRAMFQNCTILTQVPELPATTLAQYCYSWMFYGCTNLTQAPELRATTLADYCYWCMFSDCTSLTQVPKFLATTLAKYCCGWMFQNCTSLTQAPKLPATTLADYCYWYMFYNCTSLTQAPELPATTLADYCYNFMFDKCTSLTQAPELPATTLTNYCYYHMFCDCTSLTQAPELPATTLTDNCYAYMFRGCTSLTQAPKLPATTLANYCYKSMFYKCANLITLPTLPATTLTDCCYASMFDSCTNIKLSTTQTDEYNTPYRIPSSGTGISAKNALAYMFGITGGTFTGTPSINTTYYTQNTIVYSKNNYLCFTAQEANSTILLAKSGSPSWTGSYSTDGKNWSTYTLGTKLTLANVGDKVYFKGSLTANLTTSKYLYFTMTGKIAASGNVNSLHYEDDYLGKTKLDYTYEYYYLFKNCTSLTQAPELPVITLTNYCYSRMFYGCTNLASTPELPANILAKYCYQYMFYKCTSLTTLPDLPATTLSNYCYQYMFGNCTEIKLSKTQTSEYCIKFTIPSSGTGTVGTSSLSDMFTNTGGTFKGTPSINTTYYTTGIGILNETDSCVGKYADIDGDGTVDGIIFADLAVSGSGKGLGTNYSYSKSTDLKKYQVSNLTPSYEGEFGTAEVITLAKNSAGSNDRFYVMKLNDWSTNEYSWYNSATTNGISDYDTVTSKDFGTGKTNTKTMWTKWLASTYGSRDNNDIWNRYTSGWFIPSDMEWAAFAGNLNITRSNYDLYGLSDYYWSSSLINSSRAYMPRFIFNDIGIATFDNKYRIRFATTY